MAEADTLIKFSDIVIAGCTLLGPVLAVQAQKWLEAGREKRDRRLAIFRTLMATRATMLSAVHVEALNAIPIDFYGKKKVMDEWETYFQHLNSSGPENDAWYQRRVDLFVNLLTAIGREVGYSFNTAQCITSTSPRLSVFVAMIPMLSRSGWRPLCGAKLASR